MSGGEAISTPARGTTQASIEIGKQALEQQKIDREAYTKRYEQRQKKEIEDKKIQLAREQMDHEIKL